MFLLLHALPTTVSRLTRLPMVAAGGIDMPVRDITAQLAASRMTVGLF